MLIAFPAPVAPPVGSRDGYARLNRWAAWVGRGITMSLLVAVLLQLSQLDFGAVLDLLPASPLFWLAFATAYLIGPAADWVIYRRLWRIPLSGFKAILGKMIGNGLLIGYAGEVYFYTWARRTAMTSAPFGAIKDVGILSAVVGNVVTLVLLAVAFPLISTLHLGIDMRTLLLSLMLVLVTPTVVLLLGKRLFTLPRRHLVFIAAVHFGRTIIGVCLWAWAWHIALPDIALSWWLLLMAFRLFVARLPLLPNSDLMFAGLAVFLIGHDSEIGLLMTMMATLILATQIGLGLVLVTSEAIGWRRR